jgi:hypothetical protein
MIILPTGCDGVDNLIEIQINKKGGRFTCFLFDAVFSSCKEDAVERHGNNTSWAMTRTHSITSTATHARLVAGISPARALIIGTLPPRRAS